VRRGAAALVLAALLGGCGGAAHTATTTPDPFAGEPTRPVDARVARGGVLYVNDGCAACHSVDGRDLGGPTFRNMAAHRSDRALLLGVTHHIALTPPSPALRALAHRPADARALVDFIEQITTGTG
jgi:mono/diheme cytochrome c family protein